MSDFKHLFNGAPHCQGCGSELPKDVGHPILSCSKCPTKVRRFSNTPKKIGSEIPQEKVLWARRMAARFDVPGFKAEFNRRFIEEAAKHLLGTVDDEALSKSILASLNVTEDPADKIE